MSLSSNSFGLTPAQIESLARIAGQTGRPPQQVLDDALAAYEQSSPPRPANGESFYDALVRSGLLGCLKGGPTDLSTNPKYMEGFGESRRVDRGL